jgi:glycosyltransferase involved in cell wall biosynthesis
VSAVTVVIPTRNRRHALARAIASVQSQSLADWELIVVDDASNDDTAGWLGTLDEARLRVERLLEHGERSRARNHGLHLARGAATLFLDDDDRLLPDALGNLHAALERFPDAVASVGPLRTVEADTRRRQPEFPRRSLLHDPWRELLAGWVAIGGQSLTRTSVLRNVGGYRSDLSVAEDQELWLRLVDRGPVAFVPTPVLEHRPHGWMRDDPAGLGIEAEIRTSYIARQSGNHRQAAARAAAARPYLRVADISAQQGDFRTAARSLFRGLRQSPYLLVSPLIGRGLRRGLVTLSVAAGLPPAAALRLRSVVRSSRRR